MLFSTMHWRWMSARECLLAQGFPVMQESKIRGTFCSFDNPRSVWRRKRAAMYQQSGNSMNVHMIGMGLMWAFLFVNCRLDDQAPAQADVPAVEGGRVSEVDTSADVLLDFWGMASGKRQKRQHSVAHHHD